MIKLLNYLAIFIFFMASKVKALFCSAYCKPNQCTGILNTECTGCDPPFFFSLGQCSLDPNSNIYLASDSSNITISPNTNGVCSIYSIKGPISSSNTFTLTAPVVSSQHTNVRLIMWVILYDQWKEQTDYVQSRLVSTGQFFQHFASSRHASEALCSAPTTFQWFIKSDFTFVHTDIVNTISFLISAKTTGGASSWGIKDYMIIVNKSCHNYCKTCTSALVTTCTSCQTGYKLSGTTCATDCLSGYGQTTNITLCQLCDAKCQVCFQSATNCSSCKTSGANQAFLYNSNSCVNPCPTNYVADQISRTCLQCTNQACLTCNALNLSYCYQCNSTTYWYSFDCISNCPAATFPNAPNCTACDISCAICTNTPSPCSVCNTGYKLSGTVCAVNCLTQYGPTNDPLICIYCDLKCTTCYQNSTNCSSCTTSGANEAFLLGNTCINPCPSIYFSDPQTHSCVLCDNPDCLICDSLTRLTCYNCNNLSFWFNFDCKRQCPPSFYPTFPNCSSCDISCLLCTNTPSPCSKCNLNYFFLRNTCLAFCPTGYFQHQNLQQCLNCSQHCVRGTLSMRLIQNKFIQIDVSFNHPIDFSAFPISEFQNINISDPSIGLDSFTIKYEIISDRSYKITLTPKSKQLVMSNVLFTVQIYDYNTSLFSKDGYLFSQTIYLLQSQVIWTINPTWELIQLQELNNQINTFFSQKWVQQLKKTGIFALIFPGAQLCSTIILHNATPPTTMYQGARFWGSFIYFQVPQWQKDGNGMKSFFNDLLKPILNSTSRLLASNDYVEGVSWRFSRTGHTGYFIFDAYIPLIVIVICWIPLLILSLFSPKKPWVQRAKIIFFSFLHRIHQICIFYVVLAFCLEWTYFQTHTIQSFKYLSLGLSIVFILYSLFYQLHTFYKIIPFIFSDMGSKKFDFYVEKYSFFLRDLRFQQYGVFKKWEFSHILRPYNYQILSFFRLALILISLPVFQNIAYGSISCLMIIQFLEILRFILSWPYYATWRNVYKLILQIFLLLIFLLYLVADVQYRNNSSSTDLTWEQSYKTVGWLGFISVLAYNLLYFIYFCIDVVIGCRYTNRERMEYARNQYYKLMLEQYQTFQEIQNPTLRPHQVQSFFQSSFASKNSRYLNFLNKLHKAQPAIQPGVYKTTKETIQMIAFKGNLYENEIDKHWKVRLKIQQYQIKEAGDLKYSITYFKIKDLKSHLHPDLKKSDLLVPQTNTREVKITPGQNEYYFKVVDNVFKSYRTVNTESVIIKTFLKIDQNQEKQPEVDFLIQNMYQQIQVKQMNGERKKDRLPSIFKGFPVPDQLLSLL